MIVLPTLIYVPSATRDNMLPANMDMDPLIVSVFSLWGPPVRHTLILPSYQWTLSMGCRNGFRGSDEACTRGRHASDVLYGK